MNGIEGNILSGLLIGLIMLNLSTAALGATRASERVHKKYGSKLKPKAPPSAKDNSTVPVASSEEKKKGLSPSLQAWLDKMKKKAANSYTQHNQVIAVGAVRGDEAPSAAPLYWKGAKKESPVPMNEVQEFDAAVNFALNGDNDAAINRLEAFLNSHPGSDLKDDAIKTLGLLKGESAPAQ